MWSSEKIAEQDLQAEQGAVLSPFLFRLALTDGSLSLFTNKPFRMGRVSHGQDHLLLINGGMKLTLTLNLANQIRSSRRGKS